MLIPVNPQSCFLFQLLAEVGSGRLQPSRRRLKVKLRWRTEWEKQRGTEQRWGDEGSSSLTREGSKAVCHIVEWKNTLDVRDRGLGKLQRRMDGAQLERLGSDVWGFKNSYWERTIPLCLCHWLLHGVSEHFLPNSFVSDGVQRKQDLTYP